MRGILNSLGKALKPLGGGPSFLLSDWAKSHGLEYLDRDRAPGFSVAADPVRDDRFNVVHGILPGGTLGAVSHANEAIDRRSAMAKVGPIGIGTSSEHRRQAYTLVGVSAPAAGAAVLRFIFDRNTPEDEEWESLVEADLSVAKLPGWRLWHAPQAEQQVLLRLAQGSLAEWLRAAPADTYVLLRYGVLVFAYPDYLKAPQLEDLCAQTCSIGRELDEAAAALFDGQPFSQPVPPWSGPAIEPHSVGISGPVATNEPGVFGTPPGAGQFEFWMTVPQRLVERFGNLETEDSFGFQRSFPWFPVPGLPMIVLRGKLPETQIQGRAVILNDVNPSDGNRGYNAVAFEAPGAQGCEFEYDIAHNLRYSVREGVLVAYRQRDIDTGLGDTIVSLSRDAQGLAQRLGVGSVG